VTLAGEEETSNTADFGRRSVRVTLARGLLACGLSPNAVTILGTVGTVFGAIVFGARGHLFAASVIVALTVWTDSVDGTMARLSGRASASGAFLDSFLDRIADGAIYGSLAYWLFSARQLWLAVLALVGLVGSYLVSYARARAEGLGFSGTVGLGHRFNRLKITGVGTTLAGLGVPYVLEISLWVLIVVVTVTVIQRVGFVFHQARAR
jgi:CDP-diacylglycerol---glycerol-3-phosphate 3-phosphatidyltransferase